MPVYEYECQRHGLFENLVPLAESAAPSACPDCGESSRRILSAPSIYHLDRSTVIAKDRNEKSQHEPRLKQKTRCNHGVGRQQRPKAYLGPRPWVIEHS